MASRYLLLVALFIVLSCHKLTVTEASLDLVLFNSSFSDVKGAKCLDGSPGGFYLRRGKQDTKWIIFLEGGGLCFTVESCKERSTTAQGSSEYWTKFINGDALYSSDPTQNPDFHDWNHVYLPYCSGDLWSGTVTKATTTSLGVYFAGHLNLMATLDMLIAAASLGRATDVILSGSSAGGIGVFNNLDAVAEKLQGVTSVVGNPWAGWFFPKVTSYTKWQKHLPSNLTTSKPLYELYHSFVNKACVRDHTDDPWYCGPAAVQQLYPYIKSRLFVAQNMFDSDQLFGHLGCPRKNTSESNRYILHYGVQAREAMQVVKGAAKNDGFYMPSCLNHDANMFEFTSSPTVSGVTLSKALSKWYLDKETVQFVDACHTVNCNIFCGTSSKERVQGLDRNSNIDQGLEMNKWRVQDLGSNKGGATKDNHEAELLASFKKYFGLKI